MPSWMIIVEMTPIPLSRREISLSPSVVGTSHVSPNRTGPGDIRNRSRRNAEFKGIRGEVHAGLVKFESDQKRIPQIDAVANGIERKFKIRRLRNCIRPAVHRAPVLQTLWVLNQNLHFFDHKVFGSIARRVPPRHQRELRMYLTSSQEKRDAGCNLGPFAACKLQPPTHLPHPTDPTFPPVFNFPVEEHYRHPASPAHLPQPAIT